MELKKEFFQEADKAIAEFDSIYDFFKVAKSHNAYQDGARWSDFIKRIITIDVTKNASENDD